MARRERDYLLGPGREERIGTDDKPASLLLVGKSKAASISLSLFALRTSSCRPERLIAAIVSFTSISVTTAFGFVKRRQYAFPATAHTRAPRAWPPARS